jgi:hypothetical protein
MGLLDIFKKDNKAATKSANPNNFVSNSSGNNGQPPQGSTKEGNPANSTIPMAQSKDPIQNIPQSLDGSFAQASNLATNYSPTQEPAPKFPSNKPIPSIQYAPPLPPMNNPVNPSGSSMAVGTSNLKPDSISAPLPQSNVTSSMAPVPATDTPSVPLDTTFIEPTPDVESPSMPNDLSPAKNISLTTPNFEVKDSSGEDKVVEPKDLTPSLPRTEAPPVTESEKETAVTSASDNSKLDLQPVVTVEEKNPAKDKTEGTSLSENVEVSKNDGLKVLNKIALLGLQNADIQKHEILDLITFLESFSPTLIFGTNKGLVQEILPILKEKKIKNTGVYLKPFLSSETDVLEGSEVDTNVNIIHSNPFDKMKQLFREAKIFIAFESSDLNTMMEVFSIWFTATLYKGQEKPLILYGAKWNALLDVLKNNKMIDASSFGSVKVITSLEEFKTYFTNLDNDYANKKRVNLQKVFDRRVEGDEGDFIIK